MKQKWTDRYNDTRKKRHRLDVSFFSTQKRVHNKQTKSEFRNISDVYTEYKREISIMFWMDKMSGKPSFLHKKWCVYIKMNGMHAIDR